MSNSDPGMLPGDPLDPLRWLIRTKLHPSTTLAQRVAKLRWKRKRKPIEPMKGTNEHTSAEKDTEPNKS